MEIQSLYAIYRQFPAVQTDTRRLKPGDLFFALKGDNFNGNHFARQALEAGAARCVVDEDPGFTDERLVMVDDVLTTLQLLALEHRKSFIEKQVPFIAITGSNGKTTTKELVHEVLCTRFRTYTTRGNLNNHIGIPLTILSVKPDAEMAVIEMGANHQKEIESYCRYTLPTHGIITNCGKAHLEGFGGVEGVRRGKGELYDYLRASQGTAFVMQDYDYLRQMSAGIPHIVTYGTAEAGTTGQVTNSNDLLEVRIDNGETPLLLSTQLVGAYNLPNVLVAVAIGKYFGIPLTDIAAAITGYTPSNSRSQLMEKDGNKIILDAYNANPTSMRAAIENFAKMAGEDKVLLIGGMMELGDESLAEHEAILQLIGQYPWKAVALVGGDYARLTHPYLYFGDAAAAGNWLRQQAFRKCILLVKGSRSMQMEKVLEEA